MNGMIPQTPMAEIVETNYRLAGQLFNDNIDRFSGRDAAYFWTRMLDGDGETVEDYENSESVTRFDVNDEERRILGIEWDEAFLFYDYDQDTATVQAFRG